MKVQGAIAKLDPGWLRLDVGDDLARAVGLADNQAGLYVVGVRRRDGCNVAQPDATLIASPFPTQAWGNLFRASFRIPHHPGAYHALVGAMHDLRLYSRYVDGVDGVALDQVKLATSSPHTWVQPHAQDPVSAVPATAVVTFEIPAKSAVSPSRLHDILRCGQAPDARLELATALNARIGMTANPNNPRVDVEWVSPMSATNALAERFSPEIRATRQKLVALRTSPNGPFEVDLTGLSHVLWPPDRSPDHRSRGLQRQPAVVLSFADSDDRLVFWHVYSLLGRVVTRFEVVFPAGGMDHFWIQRVFAEIGIHHGNIVATMTSGRSTAAPLEHSRLGGRWSRMTVTAVFPFAPDARPGEPGDVKQIVDCLRALEDVERDSASPDAKVHQGSTHETLRVWRQQALADLMIEGRDAPLSPRVAMSIKNVEIWHPDTGTSTRGFEARMARNPYSHTEPLDNRHRERIFRGGDASGGDYSSDSRAYLATQIVREVLDGHNVAIVGAHRAGKTSLLRELQRQIETTSTHAVVLDAASTPPNLLLAAVAGALKQTKTKSPLAGVLEGMTAEQRGLGVEDLRAEARTLEQGTSEATAMHIQHSMLVLKRVLDDRPEDTLVILLDEVTDVSRWGHPAALPAWRAVIESPEFKRIRWIVSTSYPMNDSVAYSPITNVFREVNLKPLSQEEARRVIGALESGLDEEPPSDCLIPFVTIGARNMLIWATARLPYFLQVCCYHIYDQMKSRHLPVVSGRLCVSVIEEHVLPELSDHIQSQWIQLSDDARTHVLRALEPYRQTSHWVLTNPGFKVGDLSKAPPRVRKALRRSGLLGDPASGLVAPLAALWLLTSGDAEVSSGR